MMKCLKNKELYFVYNVHIFSVKYHLTVQLGYKLIVFVFILGFLTYSSLLLATSVLIFGYFKKYEDLRRTLFVGSSFIMVFVAGIVEVVRIYYIDYFPLAQWFTQLTCLFTSYTLSGFCHVSRNIPWHGTVEYYSKWIHSITLALIILSLAIAKYDLFFVPIQLLFIFVITYALIIVVKYASIEIKIQRLERIYALIALPFVPLFVFFDAFFYQIPFLYEKFPIKIYFSWFLYIILSFLFIATSHLKFKQQKEMKQGDVNPFKNLTQRENEVTILLLKGYSNKDISMSEFISEATVKTHVRNIYKKLNVSSRYELISRYSSEIEKIEDKKGFNS